MVLLYSPRLEYIMLPSAVTAASETIWSTGVPTLALFFPMSLLL